jgi:hypothetical protein
MTEGELYRKIREKKWLPDDMIGYDEKQNELDNVVTFTEIVEILDEAKQDFYCVVIGDSFENPSQEEMEERERWYKMEIEPKIKKWFGDEEVEK